MHLQRSLVLPALEAAEVVGQQRVADGVATRVWPQVTLGDIGQLVGFVDQHVVPGPVLGGPRAGHLLVPFVAQLEVGIDVDDDPPVSKAEVVDHLAHVEHGLLIVHPGRLSQTSMSQGAYES